MARAADYKQIINAMKGMEKASKKAIKATQSDFRSKMPGWIAQEVSEEYNVGSKVTNLKKLGTLNATNDRIYFGGRPRTPRNFAMSPKKPAGFKKLGKKQRKKARIPGENIDFRGKPHTSGNAGGTFATLTRVRKPYEITVQIKRGGPKTLKGQYNTPWFLAPAKNSGVMIPFQRVPGKKPGERGYLQAASTVSLPQMVSSDGKNLKPEIANVVWPKLDDRLQYHMQRFGASE